MRYPNINAPPNEDRIQTIKIIKIKYVLFQNSCFISIWDLVLMSSNESYNIINSWKNMFRMISLQG